MKRTIIIKNLKQAALLSVFFFYCCNAFAGIVFEVSPSIDVSKIKNISIEGNNLEIGYGSKVKRIELPENSLFYIAKWVENNAKGPFVFSIEGALFKGVSNDYYPNCIPKELADALFYYDAYAHSLAIGEIPKNVETHPLETKYLPANQMEELLDFNNSSLRAKWYRYIVCKYAAKPITIGEITIKALSQEKGFPVKLQIISHRWQNTSKWYRTNDVPSQWDRWALSLPYEPLKHDMEKNWDKYRKVFKPMDELSSIIEAYAILNALRLNKPEEWKELKNLINEMFEKNYDNFFSEIFTSTSPYLSYPSSFYNISGKWIDLGKSFIGNTVETSAEANLALSFIYEEYTSYYEKQNWLKGINTLAESNPRIKAKLLLIRALDSINASENYANDIPLIKDFFDLTKTSEEFFRLRVMGVHLMDRKLFYETLPIIEREKKLIIEDFIKSGERYFKPTLENFNKTGTINLDTLLMQKHDINTWENLSQNVYSVDLMSIADDVYDDSYNPEFSRIVACIHLYRGMSFQMGLELAYSHAHFRYLKYLEESSKQDENLQKLISDIRHKIAEKIGLENWEENEIYYKN